MADMINLSTLYLAFRNTFDGESTNAYTMFDRENWNVLQEAIETITTRELSDAPSDISRVKYGLKNVLYYLLMRSAEILRGEALMIKGDAGKEQVNELGHFMTVLKHNKKIMFRDSKYLINQSRQVRLRLPSRTPTDDAMHALRTYILSRAGALG